jgi:hypothetical protein
MYFNQEEEKHHNHRGDSVAHFSTMKLIVSKLQRCVSACHGIPSRPLTNLPLPTYMLPSFIRSDTVKYTISRVENSQISGHYIVVHSALVKLTVNSKLTVI